MFAIRFPEDFDMFATRSPEDFDSVVAWPRKVYIQRGYATPTSDGIQHDLYDLVYPDHERGWWVFDRQDRTLSHWFPDHHGIARCLQRFRDVDEIYIREWWSNIYS